MLFSHRSSVLCPEFFRIWDPWNFCDVISDGSTLKIIGFHHKNIIPLSILSISFQRTFLPGAGMPSALHLIALVNYFLNKGKLCSGPWQARASGPGDRSLHIRDIWGYLLHSRKFSSIFSLFPLDASRRVSPPNLCCDNQKHFEALSTVP